MIVDVCTLPTSLYVVQTLLTIRKERRTLREAHKECNIFEKETSPTYITATKTTEPHRRRGNGDESETAVYPDHFIG